MLNNPIPQSQKRFHESLGSKFISEGSPDILFLTSSSDVGVILNGGRNGARYAPQSFLSSLKKLTITEAMQELKIKVIEVANFQEEKSKFTEAQETERVRIDKALSANPKARVCHLGGGHDHVYPFLAAATSKAKKVVVINIDAHADTRNDDAPHSGTPFRQFAKSFNGEFHLFQIGLHPFANSISTLSPLENGSMNILWRNDLKESAKVREFFDLISQHTDPETYIFFSIDADALDASAVPGVSAVNAKGLNLDELSLLWLNYVKLSKRNIPAMGIYELNPVYDSVSSLSMRTMGAFVFENLVVT